MGQLIRIPIVKPLMARTFEELIVRWEVKPQPDQTFWEFLTLPFPQQLRYLAWRLLTAQGVIYSSLTNRKVIKFDYVTIDISSLEEVVAEHTKAFKAVNGKRATDIFIGRDIYPEFQALNHPARFQVPEISPYPMISGMRVHYLPWMEGLVVFRRRDLD